MIKVVQPRRRRARAVTARLRSVGFALLCLAAALGGAIAAGRTRADVGPFNATVSLRLSLTGDTVVQFAPLGSLRLDTHDGPVGLAVAAGEIDVSEGQKLIERGAGFAEVEAEIAADARSALQGVAMRAVAGAIAGALVVALLRGGGRRRLAVAATAGLFVVAGTASVARVTWEPRAFAQPTYSGLLTIAPQAVGTLEDVRARYGAYRTQLTALITNLSQLYRTASDLPAFAPQEDTVRVLHVSDLHLNPQAFDIIEQVSRQFRVDLVADTGDINDWGTPLESRFVDRIGDLDVPYVYVRGNHDSSATAAAVAAQPNALVLEDEVMEVAGLRFWGVGDPRFTPDKSEEIGVDEQADVAARFARRVQRRVAAASSVDVVLVHDPRVAVELTDETKVVLAGHTHEASAKRVSDRALLLVEGSTGGAGLRGLEEGDPVPLSCSVLYFDRDTGELRAYDRIVVDGLGGTGVRIERRVVETRLDAAEPSPGGSRTRQL